MLDFGHLPVGAQVSVFTGSGTTINANWRVWNKPRGMSHAYMLAIGAGGRGGDGFVGAVAAAGGGGGGSSGSQSTLWIPLHHLPDLLYISATWLSGNSTSARIATNPDATANNAVLVASTPATSNSGTAGAGGTGAAGGAIATIATCPIAGLGKYQFLVGQVGGTGGFNGAATALAFPTTGLICSGGGGGGGIQVATGSDGADVTGVGNIPTTLRGLAGTSGVNGTNGSVGTTFMAQLPIFVGASGGGSGFPVAVISNGANGGGASFGATIGRPGGVAYGCGGGGGGSAVTTAAAGIGGEGGPSLVIIICW